MRDLEIARVHERAQDRAAEIALLLQQHGGRQVARVGIDGIAEQHELDQRNHDDHRERDAVALELDELLDQHRYGATPEAADGVILHSRWNVTLHAHWKLSCALARRSMKTSSSEACDCVHTRSGRLRSGAIAASSAA